MYVIFSNLLYISFKYKNEKEKYLKFCNDFGKNQ